MIKFQGKDDPIEVKEYDFPKGVRMVFERNVSYTAPINKPDLHPPKYWKSRYFEGGTIEEALPHLEIAILEGCTAHWNGRQFTGADVTLQKSVLDLDDKIKEMKREAPKTKESLAV